MPMSGKFGNIQAEIQENMLRELLDPCGNAIDQGEEVLFKQIYLYVRLHLN